jgi:hypothetical protein
LHPKLIFATDKERFNEWGFRISFDFLSPNHSTLAPACIRQHPTMSIGLVEELVVGPTLGGGEEVCAIPSRPIAITQY